MPTILTHAVAGAGVAVIAGPVSSPGFIAMAMGLGALPDVDVVGFYFGVSYHSFFGHRGFSHSVACAVLVSLVVALLSPVVLGDPWWLLWLAFFLAMLSHSVLDACTDGGLGVAFFAPFNNSRYFLPWQLIQVSPIGLGSWPYTRRVLASEVRWVWLPLAVLVAIRLLFLRF